jgi:predicted lipoprotein with Yx(FWY)xxD motif
MAYTVTYTKASLGKILVDAKGMTLYVFTRDTPGKSTCTGAFIQTWHPLTVTTGVSPTAVPGITGTLGIITRDTGDLQVTYNRMPLYSFAKDTRPGDTNGQGVNNVWFIVPVTPTTSTP